MRLNSSSGGAFSLISQIILAQNGVVFGASFDENLNVMHRFIDKQSDLDLLRRSKYVESDLNTTFTQALNFLKQGRLVLFSGVSCQIHALHAFLKKPYSNLLTIEVICNSIPSSKIWDIYKESLEEEMGEKLVDFNFRGKDYGWEKGVFAAKTKTKTKTKPHYEDIFMKAFLNHTITRKSCDNCYSKAFVSNADLTLGDFWGIRNFHSDFSDEKGVSCVLAHSQKGLEFIQRIKPFCHLKPTHSAIIAVNNPALITSHSANANKEAILKRFFHIYASQSARLAIHFLSNPTLTDKKGFFHHYYRVYKDDPLRKFISTSLKKAKRMILAKWAFYCGGGGIKMKKIHILTFCTSLDNYGQILQSYALSSYLSHTFPQYEVKMLHLDPFTKPEKQKFGKKIYEKIKSLERVIRTYFHAYILRREKYILKLKNPQTYKADEKALKIESLNEARKFKPFRQRHINLHSQNCEIFTGYKDEYDADFYIVGSDQVFNCWGKLKKCKSYLDFFTLEFLPKNHKSKKLSYAASFGKREFESKEEALYFQKSLQKFDALSVREAHNIKNLEDLHLKSLVVPDPSMLLTKAEYEKLIDLSVKNKEIHPTKSDNKIRANSLFVYMLGNETTINKDDLMNFLQKDNEIIYTNANIDFSCASDFTNDFAPTPEEWLMCVKECKMLITNSFHGVSYALLMNTPFVALKLGGGAALMNTRFEQILHIVNLQNRLVENLKDLKKQMNEPINWDFVNEKLQKWRTVGVEFLHENLQSPS